MDLNSTNIITKGVFDGIIAGFIYDVISFALAFVIVKIIYERYYMKWKWGGWSVKVCRHSEDGMETIVDRALSVQAAKKILEDKGEFSIYVKGIVSPYDFLNMDIASDAAEDIGLIKRDMINQKIIIDLSKNPPMQKK